MDEAAFDALLHDAIQTAPDANVWTEPSADSSAGPRLSVPSAGERQTTSSTIYSARSSRSSRSTRSSRSSRSMSVASQRSDLSASFRSAGSGHSDSRSRASSGSGACAAERDRAKSPAQHSLFSSDEDDALASRPAPRTRQRKTKQPGLRAADLAKLSLSQSGAHPQGLRPMSVPLQNTMSRVLNWSRGASPGARSATAVRSIRTPPRPLRGLPRPKKGARAPPAARPPAAAQAEARAEGAEADTLEPEPEPGLEGSDAVLSPSETHFDSVPIKRRRAPRGPRALLGLSSSSSFRQAALGTTMDGVGRPYHVRRTPGGTFAKSARSRDGLVELALRDNRDSPGPVYNPSRTLLSRQKPAQRFTQEPRPRTTPRNWTPAGGDYQTVHEVHSPTQGSFPTGFRFNDLSRLRTPAPGYSNRRMETGDPDDHALTQFEKRRTHGKWGQEARFRPLLSTTIPGPGAFNPRPEVTREASPKCCFGKAEVPRDSYMGLSGDARSWPGPASYTPKLQDRHSPVAWLSAFQ